MQITARSGAQVPPTHPLCSSRPPRTSVCLNPTCEQQQGVCQASCRCCRSCAKRAKTQCSTRHSRIAIKNAQLVTCGLLLAFTTSNSSTTTAAIEGTRSLITAARSGHTHAPGTTRTPAPHHHCPSAPAPVCTGAAAQHSTAAADCYHPGHQACPVTAGPHHPPPLCPRLCALLRLLRTRRQKRLAAASRHVMDSASRCMMQASARWHGSYRHLDAWQRCCCTLSIILKTLQSCQTACRVGSAQGTL